MAFPLMFKNLAVVGILAVSATGLSACGAPDDDECVPIASSSSVSGQQFTANTVASIDTPMRSGKGSGSSSSKSKSSSKSSKKKHDNDCPAGYVEK